MSDAPEQKAYPKIGVSAIVMRDGKVLVGKRRGAHGPGTWSFPGGHLEFGEELEDAVRRETLEEAGIKIKNLRFAAVTNDIHETERKHYITVFFACDYDSGQVNVMEPETCEEWRWAEWTKLPEPLFLPNRNLLKSGYDPFAEKD